MAIITTLLTGGVLVGKVCQLIAGGLKNTYVDEKTGIKIAAADLTVAGVKFFQSNASGDGMENYAFNTNVDYDVSLVFPNDTSGNGLAYDLPTTKKFNITGDLATNHSPDKEMLVGPSCESQNSIANGAVRLPVVKLSFNNMKVGEKQSVYISDYELSCDTTGIKVRSGSRSLGNMLYASVRSNTGVLFANQNVIEAETTNMAEYKYPLDLGANGLKTGDCLSGQIHMEITDDALDAFNAQMSEPLHEAEERYFRKLGILK